MRRYAFVKQQSEEECGAAALATVARHYGKRVSMPLVRQLVGTGHQGTTLLGLRRGADELGFHCRALRTDVDETFFRDVHQIELPAILHWKGNHWVVLHAVHSRSVVIADPGEGVVRLPHRRFLETWGDGVLLTLEPDMARLQRQPDDQSQLHFVLRLLRLARPYGGLLARAMGLNAVVGLIGLGMPLLMQVLTDDILVRRDAQLLGVLGFGMVALYGFRHLVEFLERKISSYFFERLELALLLEYGHKLMQMPMRYFDTHRSGDILNRIIEMGRVNTMFNSLLLDLPADMFLAIVSLIVMIVYSVQLTLIALSAYLFIVLIQLAFLPRKYALGARLITKNASNQALLVEFFRGAQLLKSSNAGEQAWDEFQGDFGELARLSYQESQLTILSDGAVNLLSSMLHIGLLVYGSTFVLSGELSIGQLLAFAGLGMNVLAFFREGSRFAVEVLADRSVFARLTDVLEAEPEQKQRSTKWWIDLRGDETIELRQLNYAHPGRRQVINNINARIPGGQVTALVGGSGCGKSTLAKLLSGMYPPASGLIRYGGASQGDMALDCLRAQVCLVTQDSHFFNRSIIDNFRFVHPQAHYDAIVEACQVTMADDFITELPNGYNTTLGEFGANLSGGQKQRLAIARSLLGNPPVLILDESTSALDPVLEAQVLDRLLEFRRTLTTILISHRPSVIARCDFLLYLENGQLRHQGRISEIDTSKAPALARFLSGTADAA
jgi:ABC-type bacteriocin/lantibiotic exporter with double-glycine peptidase domain